MTDNNRRRGKDEMNFAVLPIARLGKNDKRTKLEYYGTFAQNGEQQDMVWTVDGGSGGLPTEYAERVLIALLDIGAQQGFKERKQKFTTYQVLKTLGLTINPRNYREVEKAVERLVAITIYSQNAWYDHGKKKRISTRRGFHIMEEFAFHYEDGEESDESFIVWGSRIWQSIQDGYLKYIDLDFYYDLKLPLTRRLFRFLDKIMAYQDEYQIDIEALQNKLGMAPVQYPSHLKRPIAKAAQELKDRNWLIDFEFVKVGKWHRVKFYKAAPGTYQLNLFETEDDPEIVIKPLVPEDNPWLDALGKMKTLDLNAYKQLQGSAFVGIANGLITISIGKRAERTQLIMDKNRSLRRGTLETLTELLGQEITVIEFVE